MKTAEEWFKKWFDQEEKVSPDKDDISDVIADALRHAVKLCERNRKMYEKNRHFPAALAAQACETSIEAEMMINKLTPGNYYEEQEPEA